MSPNFRKAALQTPPPPAEPICEDPATRLETMFLSIWETSMRALPFVNPALSVEAVGFRRWQSTGEFAPDTPTAADVAGAAGSAAGDWVGAVITPWFISLFVLPGGGKLWSDRRPGERCHINFPIGPLEFIADYNPAVEVPAYQYCPLFAPPSQIVSQTAARAAAAAALDTMFSAPRQEEPGSKPHGAQRESAPPEDPPRRAFFRRVARR